MVVYPFKDFAGSSHRILARLVPAHSRPGGRLLDLGAFGGELGAMIRHHFDTTFAFEYQLANLGSLRGHYDHVVMTDLERIPAVPGGMDAIVLADVLEHMRDPAALLRTAVTALTEDGRIFVSIPNVANLAIRLMLLTGRFEYDDRGILDRTHLRFYTRASARRLLEEAGLRIVLEEASTIPVRFALASLPRSVLGPLEAALIGLTRLRPTLLGYQSIFVAERRPAGGSGENEPLP
ncbi:MAG TPA: class I SAM-dependent methyltransferase [Thermoanaerobaculia bacterium]|nr:class I SAM-dependent methyltransferase [Thermoanaerobaculia bacterium]